ncbi:DUF2062 domain-containing protein [Tepidicaulis sp. LMO-SS28]|uniref:DUF2062 domain-containing protein n=1 Tax=Tepidicaulis sp. LMO-SS28 TaxID=3447455 RepID=UPI003EDEB34E
MFRRRTDLPLSERLRELVWPRSGWRRAFQYGWRRVWRLSGTPHAIAVGVAAGAFASFTPLIGFHFMLGFFVAWVFRGNLIASAFGTFVGNPITFPFIWIATYDLGRLILNAGQPTNLKPHALSSDLFFTHALDKLLPIVGPMMLGGILIGVPCSVLIYFLVRPTVETYQSKRRAVLAKRRAKERTEAHQGDTAQD